MMINVVLVIFVHCGAEQETLYMEEDESKGSDLSSSESDDDSDFT
jgi:hypothetical protein